MMMQYQLVDGVWHKRVKIGGHWIKMSINDLSWALQEAKERVEVLERAFKVLDKEHIPKDLKGEGIGMDRHNEF